MEIESNHSDAVGQLYPRITKLESLQTVNTNSEASNLHLNSIDHALYDNLSTSLLQFSSIRPSPKKKVFSLKSSVFETNRSMRSRLSTIKPPNRALQEQTQAINQLCNSLHNDTITLMSCNLNAINAPQASYLSEPSDTERRPQHEPKSKPLNTDSSIDVTLHYEHVIPTAHEAKSAMSVLNTLPPMKERLNSESLSAESQQEENTRGYIRSSLDNFHDKIRKSFAKHASTEGSADRENSFDQKGEEQSLRPKWKAIRLKQQPRNTLKVENKESFMALRQNKFKESIVSIESSQGSIIPKSKPRASQKNKDLTEILQTIIKPAKNSILLKPINKAENNETKKIKVPTAGRDDLKTKFGDVSPWKREPDFQEQKLMS